jgi:sRNA-binding protein
MTVADTFSYRPKSYTVDQLKKIARRRHTSLNRYIEEAVTQKVGREGLAGNPVEKLTRDIAKVVVEHLGEKLAKPAAADRKRIQKRFKESSKAGKWVPDRQARPGRH